MAADIGNEIKINKKKKLGRRRRGKRDVILDFTKRARKAGEPKSETAPIIGTTATINKPKEVRLQSDANQSESHDLKRKGGRIKKLTLTTSRRDYGDSLGLPEKIQQREYESTGQFFRRLDRLVANARVEANLEARFDITIPKGKKALKKSDNSTGDRSHQMKGDNDEKPQLHSKKRSHHNKRKKRVKR